MARNRSFHRAWVVMIGCCFLLMSLALVTTCMTFFLQPVSEDLGFSRASFSIYYSIAALVGVFAMPVWGRIIPKLGIKLSVAIAGGVGAAFMAAFSLCRSLIAFYICGLGMGIMIAGMTMLPASILINTWFQEKRGLAMGIVMASSGVGGAIFSPILASIIANLGWQIGYIANGIAMAVLTVPTALFLLKGSPAQMGLVPYGASEVSASGVNNGSKKQTTGVAAGVAMKSASFFLLAIAVVLLNVLASFSQHLQPHLVQIGLEATAAAGLISIYMLVVIGAKILLGIVNDRFGSVSALLFTAILWSAGFVVLAIATNYQIALIGIILFGFGIAVVTVMPPLITGQMFGQRDYSAIWSVIGALSSLGLAIGTPIIGLVYDLVGSYTLAFYGSIVVLAVTFLLLVAGLKSAKKLTWTEMSQSEDTVPKGI